MGGSRSSGARGHVERQREAGSDTASGPMCRVQDGLLGSRPRQRKRVRAARRAHAGRRKEWSGMAAAQMDGENCGQRPRRRRSRRAELSVPRPWARGSALENGVAGLRRTLPGQPGCRASCCPRCLAGHPCGTFPRGTGWQACARCSAPPGARGRACRHGGGGQRSGRVLTLGGSPAYAGLSRGPRSPVQPCADTGGAARGVGTKGVQGRCCQGATSRAAGGPGGLAVPCPLLQRHPRSCDSP